MFRVNARKKKRGDICFLSGRNKERVCVCVCVERDGENKELDLDFFEEMARMIMCHECRASNSCHFFMSFIYFITHHHCDHYCARDCF
mmetsp:Transcript_3832/g.5815  ORF Transcript_3832/g.5815 Transcript_3832/m.5815 type:complete len:88 (+) Transcript_3832:735-998(+)